MSLRLFAFPTDASSGWNRCMDADAIDNELLAAIGFLATDHEADKDCLFRAAMTGKVESPSACFAGGIDHLADGELERAVWAFAWRVTTAMNLLNIFLVLWQGKFWNNFNPERRLVLQKLRADSVKVFYR
jgi:hypothetical protein